MKFFIQNLYLLSELSKKPDKWLFELVVRLGRDIVVLQVLLSVENNLLGFDFSVFNINFVTNQNDWNVFANSDKIFIPFWNILVSNSRADIEHDNTTVSSDVVSVSKTT